ncbi:Cupin domain-containing protein [Saccharopolyspora erythraea NRRL 2338]|uniref:Cupin domain-containing protein n=1 Tax=Saccharopolyspora erythraea TaxID=1836 RepID=A0ABN1DMB9_SACER|nr:Cupin domain-containing protein [Saccharopolyspora erythraea NRRL 2338]
MLVAYGWDVTGQSSYTVPVEPAFLDTESQQAVWFLGALVRIRAGVERTAGNFALLEHQGAPRGYGSPLHRHHAEEETFFVLDGELRVVVDGVTRGAGPGAVALLPRGLPHAYVVTSPQARFLTMTTPGGFDRFVLEAGTPATSFEAPPADDVPPTLDELTRLANAYNIEILGPPPAP